MSREFKKGDLFVIQEQPDDAKLKNYVYNQYKDNNLVGRALVACAVKDSFLGSDRPLCIVFDKRRRTVPSTWCCTPQEYFPVGTKVRVHKPNEDDPFYGGWVCELEKYVGGVYEIKEHYGVSSVELKNCGVWDFSYTWLEKITDAESPSELEIALARLANDFSTTLKQKKLILQHIEELTANLRDAKKTNKSLEVDVEKYKQQRFETESNVSKWIMNSADLRLDLDEQKEDIDALRKALRKQSTEFNAFKEGLSELISRICLDYNSFKEGLSELL